VKYLAHTKDGKHFTGEENSQSLKDHLNNVSRYTEMFASDFDAGEIGALLGLVHDLGKYQMKFQDRIRGRCVRVDHATEGARLLTEKWEQLGWLHGMVVSGHHTGLKNSGSGSNKSDSSYSARLNNYQRETVDFGDEIKLPAFSPKKINCDKETMSFAFATYFKMLFSCLVDADWTDTEEYVKSVKRTGVAYTIDQLADKLSAGIPHNNGSKINTIRAEILDDCIAAAKKDQGLFTLTVPTGGGKTLSSLAFALAHARQHGLKRVIYVIPYTSIIEQNADVISGILGSEYVLEHHSQVDEDYDAMNGEDGLDNKQATQMKWASENWDIPVVLTTNVQFFESFFSNKPSKTRKLHNISKSVVIFDEAQMLPRELLSPSMYAISELVTNYRVTAVLCSATQPAIGQYKYQRLPLIEIIRDPQHLSNELKRVNYEVIGKKSDDEILQILTDNPRAMCIVNSRKHAYALYKLAKDEKQMESIYHLSTLMHSKHRRKVLKEVKEKLIRKENVILIATSLVEAGVDIDFPLVMRSIAGIDSIIQAGGRANREGKLERGRVLVFEPTSEMGKIPKSILSMVSVTQEVIRVLGEEAFENEGVQLYFENLYHASSSGNVLDVKNILGEFQVKANHYQFNFETVAKKYKIIEDNTKTVIINISDETNQPVQELRKNIFHRETIRKLQQYSVSVYKHEYEKLKAENALEILESGYSILNNSQYYDGKTGLDIFSIDNKNAECCMI
jgi:CRISPR-associated endonuclease/helicase Cas3